MKKSWYKNIVRNSTVHGLKHVFNDKLPILDRIFWAIIVLTSFGASAYSIRLVWVRYIDNPVIIAFEPTETSVMNIPFPAVTICNSNRIRKTAFQKIVGIVSNPENYSFTETLANLLVLRQIDHVCALGPSFSVWLKYSLNETTVNLCQRPGVEFHPSCTATTEDDGPDNGPENVEGVAANHTFPDDILQIFYSTFQPCNEMVPYCLWEGDLVNCTDGFREIITDLGFCCVWNMIPRPSMFKTANQSPRDEKNRPYSSEELNFWNNFDFDKILWDEGEERSKFLKYQSKAGQDAGLSLVVVPEKHEAFCMNHDAVGMRIFPHSPVEYPHPGSLGVAASPGNEVFVSLRPDITKAGREFRNVKQSSRQCYFNNEKKLESVNIYTMTNCEDECVAKDIGERCRCVRIDMPMTLFGDSGLRSLPFCEGIKLACAMNNSHVITKAVDKKCKRCWPSCNRIEYIANTASLPLRSDFEIVKDGKVLARDNVTILHIFFEANSAYSRIRRNVYSFYFEFANIGALLGLFLGVSVMTLLEPFSILFRIIAAKQKNSVRAIKTTYLD